MLVASRLPENFSELLRGHTAGSTCLYRYRIVHRGDAQDDCVAVWEVKGGREDYQIALDSAGRWHCTCADATFKEYLRPGYCKHIKAIHEYVMAM